MMYPQPSNENQKHVTRKAQALDLVCGMTVNPETAAGYYEYNGKTYYFCSTSCLAKFRAEPERFLYKPTEPIAQTYTCPMHQNNPGSCSKCGMALEPLTVSAPQQKIEYTCPMHPQIVRDKPGNCPICGMALEPRTVSLEDEKNPELVDMTRRFWVGGVLTIPLLVIAMSEFIPGNLLERVASMRTLGWIQFVLATPVGLWGGWPFFVRGWQSIVNRSLNMFTLIGLGVGVAYLFSVVEALS